MAEDGYFPAARRSASLRRALITDPELVLLDEPFAALDAITRLRMHDLVRALRARHDATMLLVTHDVDEAIGLGDRILVMRGGRIASEQIVGLDPRERSQGPARDQIRTSCSASSASRRPSLNKQAANTPNPSQLNRRAR